MTVEEKILAGSALPKNGTYTILEHMFAVGSSIHYGVETELIVENREDAVVVMTTVEYVDVED